MGCCAIGIGRDGGWKLEDGRPKSPDSGLLPMSLKGFLCKMSVVKTLH